MKAAFEVDNPKEVIFCLTITMPLRDWIKLEDQLRGASVLNLSYPSNELIDKIRNMKNQARKVYYPIEESS